MNWLSCSELDMTRIQFWIARERLVLLKAFKFKIHLNSPIRTESSPLI